MNNRPQHWSHIKERGTTIGMKILVFVHQYLGRSVFTCMLYPVIIVYYFLHREARASIDTYVEKQIQFHGLPLTPFRSGFRIFLNFAEIMLDKILAWKGLITHDDVVVKTPELFKEVNKQETGSILLIAHLGNSDACSALAHHIEHIKLTVLVYTQHAEKFNQMLPETLKNKRIEFIQVTDITPATAVMLSERIKAGEHVVIAGDRVPLTGDARSSQVDFLGAKAFFPQGGFILASILKCPMYYLYCLKDGAKYNIYLEHGPDVNVSRTKRHQLIDTWVQHFANSLQEKTSRYPLQWFNFYQFWN